MAVVRQCGKFCSRIFAQIPCPQRCPADVCSARLGLPAKQVRHNANYTSITRVHRNYYARSYPTRMVQPDGSTIVIRYPLPRKIIKLPLDLSTLNEEERLARLARRKPKQKIVVEETFEDMFDVNKYSHLWKKTK